MFSSRACCERSKGVHSVNTDSIVISVMLMFESLKQEDREFMTSLGYRASSRPAWAIQQDPVSINKNIVSSS
jgi:hypothetical protein